MHELLPAGLKVPALHALLTLVPSHWLPATHGTHPVRVSVDPPWVWLPAAQTEQLAAPARANRLSEPQFVHVLLPAELYVPGAHFTATLVPSHAYPARHALHAWRVVVVPPLVCDPVAQATHCAAADPEYSLSLPHSVHDDPPRTPLYFPAEHEVSTLDPKHANPTGHSAHEMRVLAVCPAV